MHIPVSYTHLTLGETRKSKNGEWYDDECRMVEEKRHTRLKYLQQKTTASRNNYNEKIIIAAITCTKKKENTSPKEEN